MGDRPRTYEREKCEGINVVPGWLVGWVNVVLSYLVELPFHWVTLFGFASHSNC